MTMRDNGMTLEDLYGEVRDLEESDPLAIDKVLCYYEELNFESDCFMKMLAMKLEHASITWEQPWYQQSNNITRPFKEIPDSNEESYETGTMTKDEIDSIEENWRDFIQRYNVPDKLICLARWRSPERKKPEEKARVYLVAFLARGLKRNLVQVYAHIVSYYGGHNRGHYTNDEEKLMQICFHHCPNKAATILPTVLARERRGIYKRLYFATNGKPPKFRTKWTLKLASKFLKLLMKHTGQQLEELKNKNFDKSVWMKLGNYFGKERDTLQHFWFTTLHCQLFIKCRVTINTMRKKVFKVLRRSTYKVWHDIRWKEVQSKFPDGFTAKFLYWTTRRIFNRYIQYSKVPLQQLVDYGLEQTKSKKRIARNKRLKTLILNDDGKLEVKYYDTKLRVTF